MNGAVTQSNRDSIILKGSGTTGTMFIQEGQPGLFGSTTDWYSFNPSGFGKFNDNNALCIGVRTRTVQDGTTSSPSPSDGQRVLVWQPGVGFTPGPKQGQTYVGTANVIGNSFSSYHLLNDLTVGAADTTVNGSSSIHYLSYTGETGTNIFKQRFSSSPANANNSTVLDLDGVTVLQWNSFSSLNPTEFYTTPNGAHWFEKGTILGAATTEDTMWAYDGQVRLREGRAIPGSSPSLIVGDIFQYFAAGNNWIARGRDNSGTAASAPDYVAVNGAVVARTGDPITPGSAELWGDTFYAVSINASGGYAIAGNTNNADAGRDNVLVVNGTSVVAREGDMVDLNNNGQNDDDAFIGRATGAAFDPNDVHLTVANMVYFIGYIKNGAGVDLGISPTAFLGPQALMRVAVSTAPPCGSADFDCDGDTGTDADIEAFFACLSGTCPAAPCNSTADFDGDGDVGTDADIEAFFRVLGGGNC
jgi:hypothetical protein